jgi:hypothetical protein
MPTLIMLTLIAAPFSSNTEADARAKMLWYLLENGLINASKNSGPE